MTNLDDTNSDDTSSEDDELTHGIWSFPREESAESNADALKNAKGAANGKNTSATIEGALRLKEQLDSCKPGTNDSNCDSGDGSSDSKKAGGHFSLKPDIQSEIRSERNWLPTAADMFASAEPPDFLKHVPAKSVGTRLSTDEPSATGPPLKTEEYGLPDPGFWHVPLTFLDVVRERKKEEANIKAQALNLLRKRKRETELVRGRVDTNSSSADTV